MYKVIEAFHDLQDARTVKGAVLYHYYNVGDVYPRKDHDPSPSRIEELSSSNNRLGRPLIEKMAKPAKGAAAKETVQVDEKLVDREVIDLDKLTKSQLLETAAKYGIEVDDKAKKEEIIEQMMAATTAAE